MKKLIPYGRQSITQEDIDAVVEVLQSDFLTQGPVIQKFEKAFATSIGAQYAVAVNNATAGLHIATLALSIEEGNRVITTPITFAASANCVRFSKGEVWFADIDPNTYLLSLEATEKLILSKPKNFFKGIIAVDFGGLSIDSSAFKSLAEKHGLWLLEDACHAPGAYIKQTSGEKEMCGNNASDCTVFSFHPVKHIACGEGGMVTTNSKGIYQKLLQLRSHGITKEPDLLHENHGGWYYEMQTLGYNYRLTEFQAALGITQLEKNKLGLLRRNEIADRYKNAFRGKIKFQFTPTNYFHAYHLFVIEVDDRKGLYDYLHSHGILAQIHYIPVHQLPYYKEIGYGDAPLTHSENYYSRCISLPMFPSLSNEEVDFVISTVLDYVSN